MKILSRYQYRYRFFRPLEEGLQQKRKWYGVEEEEEENDAEKRKKKMRRLAEVYCVNKKKYWCEVSATELEAPLELVPGAANESTHRIIQCKLRYNTYNFFRPISFG